MACFHPIHAWRTRWGQISIGKELADSVGLRLPCGNCLGCRQARAREWALRCRLELQQHDKAVFTTLTYDPEHEPPTLDKTHLSTWIRRLRKAVGPTRPLRFFACGEYGTRKHRPHYHAILYGISEKDRDTIHDTWAKGRTQTETVTPRSIAYVAGYTSKKIGYAKHAAEERVDPETGEVYQWQPPFIQMSRRPGIGGHARQWASSWRMFAIYDGQKIAVPRFLHEAWKKQATEEEIEKLITEKAQLNSTLSRDTSPERLEAAEKIAQKKQELQALKRKLE